MHTHLFADTYGPPLMEYGIDALLTYHYVVAQTRPFSTALTCTLSTALTYHSVVAQAHIRANSPLKHTPEAPPQSTAITYSPFITSLERGVCSLAHAALHTPLQYIPGRGGGGAVLTRPHMPCCVAVAVVQYLAVSDEDAPTFLARPRAEQARAPTPPLPPPPCTR